MEHEVEGDTNCSWCIWNDCQRNSKGTGRRINKGTSKDHPSNSIIKIGQNTERSPGDSKSRRKRTANAAEKSFQRSKIIVN